MTERPEPEVSAIDPASDMKMVLAERLGLAENREAKLVAQIETLSNELRSVRAVIYACNTGLVALDGGSVTDVRPPQLTATNGENND